MLAPNAPLAPPPINDPKETPTTNMTIAPHTINPNPIKPRIERNFDHLLVSIK